MDLDGNGKIDKYEIAVFFLKVASYYRLNNEKQIKKHMGFIPTYKQKTNIEESKREFIAINRLSNK